MRALALPLLLAALALPACDNYDSGYDDGFIDGGTRGGATFVDFTLDATDYAVSGDQKTATYETDNIDSGTTRAAVEAALGLAGEGALVMLYIQNDLVNTVGGGQSQPYTALPLSRGFEELVFADIDANNDGEADVIPVVGYTASYEFSFDNQDLYFDVVSSTAASNFGSNPRALFDFIVPQRTNAAGDRLGPSALAFRLVTVPATAGGRSAIDLTDYAAVKRAYNLPD